MRARGIAAIVIVALFGAQARPGWAADEKKACVEAAESAQDLRAASKLVAARERLLVCARDVCPAVVRKDCQQWLLEVQASTPTLVLRATKGGTEIVAVRVFVDGAALVDHLDGKAVPVDPGPHIFRFEAEDGAVIEQSIVVHEGEKSRSVAISFEGAKSAASSAPTSAASTDLTPVCEINPEACAKPVAKPADTATAPSPPTASSQIPAGAVVLGAVGVVGIAGFALFGLKGKHEIDDLRGSCAPNCNTSDVDAAKRKLLIADVSLAVGVAALGVATWILLAPRDGAPATGTLTWNVGATPRGAFAGISGAF